jgi:hypothetical protein
MLTRVTLAVLAMMALSACRRGVTSPSPVAESVEALKRPGRQTASGHAEFVNGLGGRLRFSFRAIRHRNGKVHGESEWQTWLVDKNELVFTGHVKIVCLRIASNTAFIGAEIDRFTPQFGSDFTDAFFTVEDNGEGKEQPDRASELMAGPPGHARLHCSSNPFTLALFPTTAGNIRFH